MNISKKLDKEGQNESIAEIDLYKSKNTEDLTYKTIYGKEVTLATKDFVVASIKEAVDNIPIPIEETLESLIKFSATQIDPTPEDPNPQEITNVIEFTNDALIYAGDVQNATNFGGNITAGYTIKIYTTLPNAEDYDWIIQIGNISASVSFGVYVADNGVKYSTQNLAAGVIGNVLLFTSFSSLPPNFTINDIDVRVIAKLKP